MNDFQWMFTFVGPGAMFCPDSHSLSGLRGARAQALLRRLYECEHLVDQGSDAALLSMRAQTRQASNQRRNSH